MLYFFFIREWLCSKVADVHILTWFSAVPASAKRKTVIIAIIFANTQPISKICFDQEARWLWTKQEHENLVTLYLKIINNHCLLFRVMTDASTHKRRLASYLGMIGSVRCVLKDTYVKRNDDIKAKSIVCCCCYWKLKGLSCTALPLLETTHSYISYQRKSGTKIKKKLDFFSSEETTSC